MKCPSCGRECPDEANFCYYCGFSFRNYVPVEDIMQEQIRRSEAENSANNAKPMKTWQWILYFLAMLFPYTTIVWLIISFVWAFGSKGTVERRNIARGLLLTVAIIVVLAFILVTSYISMYGIDKTIELLTGGVATSADAYKRMLETGN